MAQKSREQHGARATGVPTDRARVIRESREQDIPIEQVVPGDLILILTGPGERIPAGGELVEGSSYGVFVPIVTLVATAPFVIWLALGPEPARNHASVYCPMERRQR